MSARPGTANLQIYNTPNVASHYASLDYLTPCERFLFDSYLRPGMDILDLGVGGGRTTPYLAKIASRYAGVDYSEQMIQRCRVKFPELEFLVTDVSDLSTFPDASFDAIVFAFNGLDYVLPQEKRWQCIQECGRMLRAEGVLIFSSHNPRAILVRPGWDQGKLRARARKITGDRTYLFLPLLPVMTVLKATHALLRAGGGSAVRVLRRVTQPAFWHGEGCFRDSAHGGLTHYWVPERAVTELAHFDFQLAVLMGDDYPSRSWVFVTDWYYYVFSKVNRSTGGASCT
jgi:ubiquinone/menaquinone biosynthesis C-methylase UbiE